MASLRRILLLILCFSILCIPVQGAESEKLVALTFDDGPSGRFTRTLLEGLEARNTKATFFLCGYRMEQDPDLTTRIFQEGHEIGLHGYSHKCMLNMCQYDIAQELERAMSLLPAGCQVAFLRSPGGLCNKYVRSAAEALDLSVLSWSVDPKDWATHNASAIKKEVITHVRDGDIILLHDMSDSSVEAALAIIDTLREEGYRFVTVSELARSKGITPAPGKEYRRFGKS